MLLELFHSIFLNSDLLREIYSFLPGKKLNELINGDFFAMMNNKYVIYNAPNLKFTDDSMIFANFYKNKDLKKLLNVLEIKQNSKISLNSIKMVIRNNNSELLEYCLKQIKITKLINDELIIYSVIVDRLKMFEILPKKPYHYIAAMNLVAIYLYYDFIVYLYPHRINITVTNLISNCIVNKNFKILEYLVKNHYNITESDICKAIDTKDNKLIHTLINKNTKKMIKLLLMENFEYDAILYLIDKGLAFPKNYISLM